MDARSRRLRWNGVRRAARRGIGAGCAASVADRGRIQRSSRDDPTAVQEEQDEKSTDTDAATRSPAPAQHSVGPRKASGGSGELALDGVPTARQGRGRDYRTLMQITNRPSAMGRQEISSNKLDLRRSPSGSGRQHGSGKITRTGAFRAAIADGTIRRLIVDNGLSRPDLALRYGISIASVHLLLRGTDFHLKRRIFLQRLRAERKQERRNERELAKSARADHIQRALRTGQSLTEIAAGLGCSVSAASRFAKRASIGIPRYQSKRVPVLAQRRADRQKTRIADLRKIAAAVGTISDAQQRLGLSSIWIYQILKATDVQVAPKRKLSSPAQQKSTASIRADVSAGLLVIGPIRIEPHKLGAALAELGYRLTAIRTRRQAD
jgi:hypothetical protein